ncbi:hypothetical protein DPMN_156194 [Dreissena polymorpha]|uniref:NACHT domain-containing protein n=1 Tax=Dreissena polymorpha TaxID=45954 RepID=A0A9D4FQS7_DREPO|nr:hypothetical protein DPMN_156194 [Dreissena polymorpha]
MGKTTFLTELALDWCDAVSVHNPDHKPTFSDVDTLKKFQFLFQISLRDATDQREVIEMIKTQIIHMIYTDAKREEIVKLLPQIMERESCIVTLDGLNEWVDRLNKCVIPFLAQCHIKCVSVITSRPWKMADERIKDSEINSLIEIEGIIDSEKLAKKIIHSLQTGNVKTHTEFMTYVNERQLSHFLTSPWRLTMLVNLWMNYKVSGSLCELNCILIDILFKNANARKGYFQKGGSFQCLSNTRFIQQQIDIFDALAKAAFYLTFSFNKSLLFTERELLNYISDVQLEFCLNAGVLTKRYMSYEADEDVQFSFVHETVQEFLAAYHIAKSNLDCITHFQIESKYNVLEMSEIIIFLCGLDCKKANQLLNMLADVKFLNDINHGLSMYVKHFLDSEDALAFQTDNNTKRYILKSNNTEMKHAARCFALSVLFQRMIIAGYKEAKASGEKDICLNCTDFTFDTHLNKCDSNALKTLLLSKKSDVRSLILESNVLKTSEILSVIQQSKKSLKRLKMRVTEEINKTLYHTSIQELNFIGTINVSSFSGIFPTLSQLTFLEIEGSTFSEDIDLPDTFQEIHLMNCTCTAVFLRRLLLRLSSLKPYVILLLYRVNLTDNNTLLFQPELLSIDMKDIFLVVRHGNSDLYNLLRCTSIEVFLLETAECASLVAEILPTLNKLTKLGLRVSYTGRCDLKLPASLQDVHLHKCECSSKWLCGFLITLSTLAHPVKCHLRDVILQPFEEACGDDNHLHLSDLRSEIVSRDLSNIGISVQNGSMELLEILRDTNIGNLDLGLAECASLASEILHTLHMLKDLYLRGTYTGQCNLKLPASIQYVSLIECKCSSEWLCSLLITLSSLPHPVECELRDVELQPYEEARGDEYHIHVSDLRSEIVSRDLSYVGIIVRNGSFELMEILRDTSIGNLYLSSADCASLASEILHTLNKLTTLYLNGTFTGRCNLRLPASLQCISLLVVECTHEWLCSLLITLSTLDHPVECELRDVVLQPLEEAHRGDSQIHVSELRSEIMSRDMFQFEILLDNVSEDVLEIFRDTSIGILYLETADCAQLASEILHTLNKLKKLYLGGNYTGRFDHRLPVSLQHICLQKVECSSEWLCSLLITLSSLDHYVDCELRDVVFQPSQEARGDDYNIHRSDLRSEILLRDLSNIKILVTNGSTELFEIFRDSSIRSLEVIDIDNGS